MRAASPPAAGRPRHAVKTALLISATVHSLLTLGFLLSRTPSPAETPIIDSRVSLSEGALLLSFDDSRSAGKEPSKPPTFTVQVAQSAPAAPAGSGPAPSVDLGPLPRFQTAQGAGHRSTGGGAAGSFFRTPIKGRSVVYVIDRSLSMGGPAGGLAVARAELLASLEGLPPSVRFQVIFYNNTAQPLRVGSAEGLLPAEPEALQAAAAITRATWAEGNTDHVQALRCGLALCPDVLFLVTDADDLSPEQVRAVTLLNHGRTIIHAVCVARRPQGTAALEQLARANGGLCLHPQSESGLTPR